MEVLDPEMVIVDPEGDSGPAQRRRDTLHGRTLREGHLVNVTWPDGKVTREVIHLDKRERFSTNGSSVFLAPDHRAYVELNVNGADVRVYLRWKPFIKLNFCACA